MNCKWTPLFAAALMLSTGGTALQRLLPPDKLPPGRDRVTLMAAGQFGLAGALLGGFQTLAADVAWLRVWAQWERHDRPTTELLMRVTCSLNPQSLYFWLNAARIIAYDFPTWSGDGGAQKAKRRSQAGVALEFLAAADRWHARNPQLWIERAGLELNGRGNVAAAAAYYRRAAELPGCPAFAGRLHAQLLRRTGHHPELHVLPEKSYPAAGQSIESSSVPVVSATP